MREDIYKMFQHYNPEFQYHWNNIINSGLKRFAEELDDLAGGFDVSQEIEDSMVFWKNDDNAVEAMFAYVIDPTDLKGIMHAFRLIKKRKVPVAFVFIEQRADGERMYDIFRLSEKSYLEHCNRAWAEGTSLDPL